jgi:hypothetical protein
LNALRSTLSRNAESSLRDARTLLRGDYESRDVTIMVSKAFPLAMDRVKTSALSGAEIVVRCLQEEGVEYVFGYPGGAVLFIYDELFKQDKVKHVLVRQSRARCTPPTATRARPKKSAWRSSRPAPA